MKLFRMSTAAIGRPHFAPQGLWVPYVPLQKKPGQWSFGLYSDDKGKWILAYMSESACQASMDRAPDHVKQIWGPNAHPMEVSEANMQKEVLKHKDLGYTGYAIDCGSSREFTRWPQNGEPGS